MNLPWSEIAIVSQCPWFPEEINRTILNNIKHLNIILMVCEVLRTAVHRWKRQHVRGLWTMNDVLKLYQGWTVGLFLWRVTVIVILKCIFLIYNHFTVLQIYACEESNQHSGALVFLLGQLLASIPFLFLISVSSSLIFYFLIGLRDEFSLLMYFVLNFFTCLLVNEGLTLVVASIWQDAFWSILTLVCIHVSSTCCSTSLKLAFFLFNFWS